MYVLIFGDYEPILIGDKLFWKDLYNFFSNGNILIVFFIFCFVKFVVLEMLSSLTFLIVNLIPKFISNKPDPFKDDSFFRFMLKQFGILVFDKEKHTMPTPGKNFHLVIDFLQGINKHQLRKEFIEIRNTNIFEIFNLYAVFSLVYYFILTNLHNPTINKLVIIGFVIVLYFLFSIEYFFHLIYSNFENVSKSMKLIHQINATEQFFKENIFLSPNSEELTSNLGYTNMIQNNDITYHIQHYVQGKRIIPHLRNIENDNPYAKILVISSEKINPSISTHFNKKIVEVIRFKNERKFIKSLEKYFFSEK